MNSLKSLADLRPVTSGVDSVDVPVVIWRDGDTQNTSLRPGRMGLALARESAPEYLASKYRDEQIFLTARSGNTLLAPLPATAWEVASLQRRFGATTQPAETLLGLKASEQALWERADNGRLASYRYIHLATHGRIDDLFPQRSAIVLTQVGLPDALVQVRNNRPVFDGQISVSEIAANWTLRAELVTLSACQTALGRQAAGEGYVGFTQALLLAGADSVCLSLWDVDDTATALLMDRFYANLLGKRDGLTAPLPKADALAEAQAWLREVTVAEATDRSASLSKGVSRGVGHKTNVIRSTETRPSDLDARPYDDPYYWAAFILIGRTE